MLRVNAALPVPRGAMMLLYSFFEVPLVRNLSSSSWASVASEGTSPACCNRRLCSFFLSMRSSALQSIFSCFSKCSSCSRAVAFSASRCFNSSLWTCLIAAISICKLSTYSQHTIRFGNQQSVKVICRKDHSGVFWWYEPSFEQTNLCGSLLFQTEDFFAHECMHACCETKLFMLQSQLATNITASYGCRSDSIASVFIDQAKHFLWLV